MGKIAASKLVDSAVFARISASNTPTGSNCVFSWVSLFESGCLALRPLCSTRWLAAAASSRCWLSANWSAFWAPVRLMWFWCLVLRHYGRSCSFGRVFGSMISAAELSWNFTISIWWGSRREVLCHRWQLVLWFIVLGSFYIAIILSDIFFSECCFLYSYFSFDRSPVIFAPLLAKYAPWMNSSFHPWSSIPKCS